MFKIFSFFCLSFSAFSAFAQNTDFYALTLKNDPKTGYQMGGSKFVFQLYGCDGLFQQCEFVANVPLDQLKLNSEGFSMGVPITRMSVASDFSVSQDTAIFISNGTNGSFLKLQKDVLEPKQIKASGIRVRIGFRLAGFPTFNNGSELVLKVDENFMSFDKGEDLEKRPNFAICDIKSENGKCKTSLLDVKKPQKNMEVLPIWYDGASVIAAVQNEYSLETKAVINQCDLKTKKCNVLASLSSPVKKMLKVKNRPYLLVDSGDYTEIFTCEWNSKFPEQSCKKVELKMDAPFQINRDNDLDSNKDKSESQVFEDDFLMISSTASGLNISSRNYTSDGENLIALAQDGFRIFRCQPDAAGLHFDCKVQKTFFDAQKDKLRILTLKRAIK